MLQPESLAVSLSASLENWKATQLVEQQESPKEECSVMVNRGNGISWRFIVTRRTVQSQLPQCGCCLV